MIIIKGLDLRNKQMLSAGDADTPYAEIKAQHML